MTAKERAEQQHRAVTLYRDMILKELERTGKAAEPLLNILGTYLSDQQRQIDDRFPSFAEFIALKQAIVDSMDLLWAFAFDRDTEMTGWREGGHPRNETQRLANIVSELARDMARVTEQVERSMPELRAGFDRIQQRQFAGLPLLPTIH
jgi:hypothetical protein